MRVLDKHKELLLKRLELDIEIREFVNEYLKIDYNMTTPRKLTERVAEICCDYSGIPVEKVVSRTRKRDISNLKLIISLIAHRDYKVDSVIVGDFLNVEASTVRHRTSDHDDRIFFKCRDEILIAYEHCKILCDANINFEYEEKD